MKRVVFAAASLLFPLLAFAAGPQIVGATDEIDPMEVARVLNPQKFKTRSLTPPADSLALPINFAFGSATVPASAMRSLKGFAQGIQLAGAPVLIEGHTDAVGSAEYNRALSKKRAEAVRDFLATRHGVDPKMMRAEGKGKAELLPDRDPASPEQRRVEFRADNG
jgi:outer membrane protein OmpA-like peptidoglycan-associated protein